MGEMLATMSSYELGLHMALSQIQSREARQEANRARNR